MAIYFFYGYRNSVLRKHNQAAADGAGPRR
jgi:cbb3-type cytochrome oxidase subunit 3